MRAVGWMTATGLQAVDGLKIKQRESLMESYLNPAVSEGYAAPLYSADTGHPRQKYLLTTEGLALNNGPAWRPLTPQGQRKGNESGR